jgi:hypothetical protein
VAVKVNGGGDRLVPGCGRSLGDRYRCMTTSHKPPLILAKPAHPLTLACFKIAGF